MRHAHPLALLFQLHYADIRAQIAAKFRRPPQETEDIVQDAFHNILRANNLEALENPKAYLYKTASNLALNRLRQHRLNAQAIDTQEAPMHAEQDEISPERQVLAQQDLARLYTALNSIPEKYRRTFLLSRMHNKTYKEISEQLNIAESTVEKHIIKVLKCLREHLQEDCS
ncbi:MAG TPA: sigma-70 family RNA polymerase sigma factor [Cellvibrionaceae bacterium]|nr:sigma-70 family RNA polymerase sigma factor [Cellvibrionaceae bacterium]HNG61648.1 sigma-70 family RNA polymerase sigma factor [Cellvibrionaceae bacterium]